MLITHSPFILEHMLHCRESALKYYSDICEDSALIALTTYELLNLVQQLISAVFCMANPLEQPKHNRKYIEAGMKTNIIGYQCIFLEAGDYISNKIDSISIN